MLREKLERMRWKIFFRVHYGYARFQHDEEWQYITMEDARVCVEHCAPLHGYVFRGDYVLSVFEYAVSADAKTVTANQHNNCRCILRWINASEVILQRLHEELAEVAS